MAKSKYHKMSEVALEITGALWALEKQLETARYSTWSIGRKYDKINRDLAKRLDETFPDMDITFHVMPRNIQPDTSGND